MNLESMKARFSKVKSGGLTALGYGNTALKILALAVLAYLLLMPFVQPLLAAAWSVWPVLFAPALGILAGVFIAWKSGDRSLLFRRYLILALLVIPLTGILWYNNSADWV